MSIKARRLVLANNEGAAMSYILRKISALSVEQRDILLGASIAFDPYPASQFQYFINDDELAFLSDWNAIGRDMNLVIAQKQNERLRSNR